MEPKLTYEAMRHRGRCVNITDGKQCLGNINVTDERIECLRCSIVVFRKDNYSTYMHKNQLEDNDNW